MRGRVVSLREKGCGIPKNRRFHCVAASTVLARQHHVADDVTGWALGLAGYAWLCKGMTRPAAVATGRDRAPV